jgi:hypothetical protein
MTQRTAAEAYAAHLAQVQEDLQRLSRMVATMRRREGDAALNWANVGDAAYLREQIEQVLEHFQVPA